jgi:aminotransferase
LLRRVTTSGIVTEDRLREIARIVVRHNLLVISDEIYENYVYDGWKHFSIGSLPDMAERTITLNGFSKTYIMTGLRVGFVAAPKDVICAMECMKSLTSGPTATVAQRAALAAVTGSRESARKHLEIFTQRRAVMLAGLRALGLDYSDMRGAYYVWTNTNSVGIDAGELAYLLLQEAHVLIFSGANFGENWRDYLRFSLVDDTPIIEEALERMRGVIERYRT